MGELWPSYGVSFGAILKKKDYVYSEGMKCNLQFEIMKHKSNQLITSQVSEQSSKLTGSPKSEASEIWVGTSEPILVLVRSD